MDQKALFRIEYGLYLATTHKAGVDNGAILNAVIQVTNSPARVAVTVNKGSLTHDWIAETGKLNLCPLSEKTPFSIFQNFGMQSGRDADKFAGARAFRTENGLYFLPDFVNTVISLRVMQSNDLGTHTMFVCDVEDAMILSDEPTMTYSYYHANVKQAPQKKRGYVCRICGYVYEGDPLPEDFICPLCGHGVEDFERLA